MRINGVKIKEPSLVKVSHYNLTKSGRVASGAMTMSLVAKKVTLEVSYEVISGADLQQILNLIDGNAMFFEVEYYEANGATRIITCYAGSIPYETFRQGHKDPLNGWYWRGVQFQLIER